MPTKKLVASSRSLTIPYKNTYSTNIPRAFKNGKFAEFLAAATTSASIPSLHGLPEVIVTGRANVGKSTLLNAIAGRRDLFHASKKPGRTQSLNFFRLGPLPGSVVLVDAPGYGARGRKEWGALFDSYLDQRTVLRRIYILFNAKHGLSEIDQAMLHHLEHKCQTSQFNLTVQAVITKADTVPPKELASRISGMRSQINEASMNCLPPIITSSNTSPPFGIEEVRKSIAEGCGLT